MNLANILVAVDFSPASLAALRRAVEMLAPGDTLRLLHVIGVYPAAHRDRHEVERLCQDLEERARWKLGELSEEARRSGAANVEIETALGRPADEVIAAAECCGASLVACGAHARGAASRFLLGSVTEEIARRSPIPTLVVRELAEGTKPARVLVAVGRDAASGDVARAAVALARRIGAPLEAIHALELPALPLEAIAPGPLPFPFGDLRAAKSEGPPELVSDARAAVAGELERATGERIATRFVAGGSPALEVLRHARPSDILVCGTHGRSALGRLAFGSVALKLLRRAPCPVLVVRPGEPADRVAPVAASARGGAAC